MFTMREFENYIMETLKERMPECKITSNKVLKNNGTELTGICIKPADKNFGPNIYINKMYERYLDGDHLDEIIDEIQHIYNVHGNPEFDMDDMTIFDNVKDKLDVKIINTALNEEYLKRIPSMSFMDLSIVARIRVNENASIVITNGLLDQWGLTKGYVLGYAIAHTMSHNKISIRPIGEVLAEIMHRPVPEEVDKTFYICKTNEDNGMYGARAMMFTKDLMEFAKSIDSDLYVIPSSVHEILLIPVKSNAAHDEVNRMIQGVNRDAVENEDILSDHVYIFHKDTGFES